MKTNRLTKSGIAISALGLGCASLGGIFSPVTDQDADDNIRNALDNGITYFDTAPFYGYGLSEHRTGRGLRNKPAVVSTKVGRLLRPGAAADPGAWVDALPFTPVFDYSYDAIMRSFEDSLQRIGRDRIDILYLHDIGNLTHGPNDGPHHFETAMNGGYRALETLRSGGVIGAIGIGVNEVQVCLDVLERGDWDVFLLAGRYTLLEQAPLKDLFPACQRSSTDIVIGGPFNSGVLAGGDKYDYVAVPRHVADKVQRIRAICADHGVELPSAALAFCNAHEIVKSTIPGPRNALELNQILSWWQTPIPTSFWSDLRTAGLIHPESPTPAG